MEKNLTQPPFKFRLTTVLRFPKHPGMTLKEAIDTDLEWVKWLHNKGKINWTVDAHNYFDEKCGGSGGFRKTAARRGRY